MAKNVLRHGNLFFGGREATTGNASAVRRLHILLCEMDLGGYLVITLAINNGYIGLSGVQFGLQSYE